MRKQIRRKLPVNEGERSSTLRLRSGVTRIQVAKEQRVSLYLILFSTLSVGFSLFYGGPERSKVL